MEFINFNGKKIQVTRVYRKKPVASMVGIKPAASSNVYGYVTVTPPSNLEALGETLKIGRRLGSSVVSSMYYLFH